MSSWARPGVKCVCVNAFRKRSSPRSGVGPKLTKGATYTVRMVDSYGRLHLEETALNDGSGFFIDRFRPLVTKTQEQDVAIFRHHLTDEPVDA